MNCVTACSYSCKYIILHTCFTSSGVYGSVWLGDRQHRDIIIYCPIKFMWHLNSNLSDGQCNIIVYEIDYLIDKDIALSN